MNQERIREITTEMGGILTRSFHLLGASDDNLLGPILTPAEAREACGE